MPRISALTGKPVLLLKKTKKDKDGVVTDKYQKFGRLRAAVFSPDGRRVVGFVVKRPDVVGMIRRGDAFVALDALGRFDEKNMLVSRPEDGLDDAALRRLDLDWDNCIMWAGMDAKTTDGKPLGYVSDAEYDEKTGQVTRFFTDDGGMAKALIGSFVIAPEMVRGYSNGFMVVDTQGERVSLDGGLAGAAGEGYARAKAGASKLGKKAGAAAGEVVDKGSFALGRALGKAKRAMAEAAEDEPRPKDAKGAEDAASPRPAVPAADVRVEKPVERIAEKSAPTAGDSKKAPVKTYAPAAKKGAASKKPAATKKQATAKKPVTTSDKVARAAGKQLGAFGKMFGDFKDEFNKASK